MKKILHVAALAICAIFMVANVSAQDNYNATTMGNIVRYYETAKWSQGSPFNNQCWTNATQQTHAKTGCVPTAFAIIMRHHGFPAEGFGTLYNQQTGEVFTDRTYDYSKMPLTGASGWTTEQQNEVAKLMAHLGHAFGVTFGSGTTSVSIGNTMSERMQKFFNYNYAPVSNQYAGSGQMYDFEEWKKNLKNSLDNGCPVPYAADNKKDGTNDTRHMFVVDGYTENEYFHFNFGWGGGSNGWYKLDDITPTGDDYSWRTTSDGYDSKHQAFFNLMPNTTTYAVTATVNDSNMGTVSINNGTAGSTATANLMQGVTATLTAHPADGYALASWTKGGVVVGSRTTLEVKVGTDANDYVANFDDEANVLVEKDCKFTITDVTTSGINGNYCSTWTTNDGIVLSCTKGSEAAYALSTSVNTFFAKAAVVSNSETLVTDITYTLTAPAGYIIKSYSFKGKSPSSSYTIDVTVGGNTTNVTNASAGVVISASDINAQSTSFVLSSTYAGRAGLAIMDGVTVTIQSEGGNTGEGGEGTPTPTPEPEPEPEQPTDPLAGKYFRLKVYNDGRYMNVKNHTEHAQKVSAGGVNVAAKVEDSNAQIFFFEQSGNGYMLKDGDGYYIKGLEWSVDASSTTSGSVLLFEETAIEDVYYIKWNNTYKGDERYFKVGADSNGAGDHPYCDVAANQKETAAAKWVLEEVIPSNEKTLTVTYSGATWNNEASGWWVSVVTNTTPAVTVKTTDGTPKIGYSTFNEVRHPYLLDGNSFTISVPANCKITGYRLGYKAHNLVSKSVTYTNGKQSTGTLTIAQSDEQNTLTVTGLDNSEIAISVEDQTTQAGFIIKSLEITYIENEFTPLPFKAEIEGWRNDNPNTHLGTITIGGTAMKLTPAHQTASELTMPVVEGTTLAFTRKYRGFEFNGFYIGATSLGENPTLTADNVAAIDENNPLIAKFTATDDVTLFYDDDTYSYRIPAIAKTGNGMLVAVSDYRHNLDDIGRDNHGTGKMRIDLVARTSDDNGATWSDIKTIAAGDDSKIGSYQRAYGDAAIAAVGENIVVMAAAGDVMYSSQTANATNPNKMVRVFSSDNGANWSITDMTTKMYSTATSLFPNHFCAFFGSGKLAVDYNYNGTSNARIYGALLMRNSSTAYNNFVVYSDDLGENWSILGGSQDKIAGGDEPKVEILPNGQILLSARRQGGRIFRVFTYSNKATNEGSWGDAAVNGCDNGGSNGTNGEIICLDAKRPNGKPTKILLQSQPKGGAGHYDRYNVTIWYKEVSADETYTPSSFASGWTQGIEVCPAGVKSAYSAMALQENGEIAFFFEEAPCYGDDHTKGYSMVYVPLTIEEITGENFLNPNAVVETVTVDVTLTDEQGNTYTHQFDYLPGDAAAIDAALTTAYPFITLGAEGNLQGSGTYYTYTNTVTLPFKVSNANTTVWHNIYWPANTAENDYPIYLSASAANDTYVPKVTESKAYGESTYNTLQNGDKISWAIYSVDNTLTFKFKNKLTGKYIQATSVATGNAQNVVYANENNATAFELLPDSYSYAGDYALVAKVGETTGYLCSTSATGYHYATHYNGSSTNRHEGAWVKFVEAPDYQAIINALTENVAKFGAGNGNYTDNNDINAIKAIIEDIETTPLNTLNTHTTTVQTVKESYTEITLTVPAVNDVVPGSVKILNEPVSHKFVPKGNVTIQAVPAAGYRFVNWTRPAAQASAAARTAEARNSDVVSTDNPYTVTVSEALSLEANFEQIVVNVTLTDAQSNTYEVQLSGFTAEITKDAVADKLREAYPYITLGTTDQEGNVIDFGVLNIDGTAYTYTNRVELPFKVSSVSDYWHNIYYPSNNKTHSGYPNYIAAFNDEDNIVDMAESPDYAYGANPTYNTKAGNPMISWAVYSVNNSFEFVFKNELTNKYIKVESVVNATGNTQNVKFVENAGDATAFTLLKDAGSYNGDYALVAKVGDATGYLCATSSSTNFVTHFDRNNHQGAWVKFVEVDYGQYIGILDTKLSKFDVGDDKHMITDEIQQMINALVDDYGVNITKSQFEAYFDAIDAMDAENWPKLSLTIAPDKSGTTTIAGEEGVTRKYVPTGDLTINATPAEGYHFVSWTDGTSEVSTEANYTFNITAATELTANFEKNTYTISVLAGEGGSAMIGTETSTTVEHGGEVTLTAAANDGYRFVNWTKGTEVVSTDVNYTFTATADGEYVANFELANTCRVEFNCNYRFGYINVYNADGTERIGGTYEAVVEVGTTIQMVATPENNYQFTNWTDGIGGNVLSSANPYVFTVENDITLYANFEPRHYVLTVRANNDNYGTVTAESGTFGPASSVKVGIGMTATITATAKSGYEFVNWTKGTDVVSTDATYTIPAINEVNNMVDAEYIANFVEIENVTAGTYYRIGYDFQTAANAGAARAAGSTQTITLLETGELGGIKSNSKNSEWNSDYLSMHATGGNSGNPVYAIYKSGTSYFRLFGYTNDANTNTYNNIKYTLTAKEGYIITGCSFSYTQKIAGAVTINYNGASENSNDVSSHDWAITPNAQTVEITLSTTTNNSSNYLTVKNFTVTIQQVGEGEGGGETPEPETPANRYYMQSVACGVSGGNNLPNALKMTQDTLAASIFYYADSKLLSYDKGTYIKEDGGTRGLQDVGASGTVTITTDPVTSKSKIQAPSYMHANSNGTTYYVDHCGSDNGHPEHNFIIEEVTTLPVTISSALHATFYAPVAVAIPEGVKAYVLKTSGIDGVETYAWMTSLKNGVIPANTGVIIKGAQGTHYFNITENTDAARAEAVGNVLSGTVAKTKITHDAYILANKSKGVGLYPVAKNSYLDNNTNETTVRFTNNSHKAYLPVTNDWFGEQLKKGTGFRFIYDDDETTGIDEVETENTDTIYDLQGRKLSEITEPGIYIVGGKKVWIK